MAITTLLTIVKETIEKLHFLPRHMRDRLIALKQEHPYTPLQKLPLPVRAEVKQILTSATAESKSSPRPRASATQTSTHPALPQAQAPTIHTNLSGRQANGTMPQPNAPDENALTVLGTDSQTGRAVTLSLKERYQGLYVTAATYQRQSTPQGETPARADIEE